jgi:hypothetical protein
MIAQSGKTAILNTVFGIYSKLQGLWYAVCDFHGLTRLSGNKKVVLVVEYHNSVLHDAIN